jgi:hypothetical protein
MIREVVLAMHDFDNLRLDDRVADLALLRVQIDEVALAVEVFVRPNDVLLT